MENGKRIDAFLQPEEESYFIFWLHPTSNGNGKKYQNSPLCLITSQPTDSDKSPMDIDYG